MTTTTCPNCKTELSPQTLSGSLYVCPRCGTYLHMPARERIMMLADPRAFKELDRGLVSVDPLRFTDQRSYRERLAEARRRTGLREAVVIGEARLEGRPVVLVVFDFDFMGGTMGSVVGEKVADAFEHATRRRWPVVSVGASGGARMQEGMLSLMQMAKTAATRAGHDRAGLAHIAVLTDPTFGGVAASFASLADILIAEPGAEIGFVGPRVIDLTLNEPQPADSHRAEALFRAGMVDLVVGRPELRATIAFLVGHLSRPSARRARAVRVRAGAGVIRSVPEQSPPPPWHTVQLARHVGRPTSLEYITRLFARFVELHGVGPRAQAPGHGVPPDADCERGDRRRGQRGGAGAGRRRSLPHAAERDLFRHLPGGRGGHPLPGRGQGPAGGGSAENYRRRSPPSGGDRRDCSRARRRRAYRCRPGRATAWRRAAGDAARPHPDERRYPLAPALPEVPAHRQGRRLLASSCAPRDAGALGCP